MTEIEKGIDFHSGICIIDGETDKFHRFSLVGDITAGERAENIKGEDEMKTILKKLFLPLVALMVVAAFVFTACGTTDDPQGGGGGGSPVVPDEEYYIVDIEMITPPTNSDYGVGGVFDPTGMVLKIRVIRITVTGGQISNSLRIRSKICLATEGTDTVIPVPGIHIHGLPVRVRTMNRHGAKRFHCC